jgi:hypothetical protein
LSVPEDKGNIEKRHSDDIDDIGSNTMAALRTFHETSSKIVLMGGLGAGINA